MGFDRLAWELKLKALIAEANVYANETAQALIEDPYRLSAAIDTAYVWAERWKVVQDEIQLHMNTQGGRT